MTTQTTIPAILPAQQQDVIMYASADGNISVALMAKDGNVWLNQSQLAELFATSKQNIGQHISNILKDNELPHNSVVKNFFTTASDGKQYYEEFDARRKRVDALQADKNDDDELLRLIQSLPHTNPKPLNK